MTESINATWYILAGRGWRDHVNLLHLPYTVWHLSYVVIGASLAPTLHLDRLAYILVAFFLGLGIGAHYLDELNGRPIRTRISDQTLSAVALLALLSASAVGVWGSVMVSLTFIPLVFFGFFMVYAYNLELFRGRLHNVYWFSLGWGAFPVVTGFYVNALSITPAVLAMATACFALSGTQQVLSNHVKAIRRRVDVVGTISFASGESKPLEKAFLVEAAESALKLLSVTVVVFSIALFLSRLT
ncbi:MAG: hypothetical protein ACE5IB_06870 [Candidatus Geothermarchaeales archaeon]